MTSARRLVIVLVLALGPLPSTRAQPGGSPPPPAPADPAASSADTAAKETGRLLGQGRYRAALEAASREHGKLVAAEGPDAADSLRAANNLAVVLARSGKLDEAKALAEQTLDARRRTLGTDHPDTFTSANNLGVILHATGALSQAKTSLEEALAGRRRLLGDRHPATAQTMASLGRTLADLGGATEGLKMLEDAYAIQSADPATPRTELAITRCVLARARLDANGRKAAPLAREACDDSEKAFGADHPRQALVMAILSAGFDVQEAGRAFSRARAIHKAAGTDDTPEYAAILALHAEYAVGTDLALDPAPTPEAVRSARRVAEEAYEVCGRTLGSNHPLTASAANHLGLVLNREPDADRDRAARLFDEAVAIRTSAFGEDHPDTAESIVNRVALQFVSGDPPPLEALAPAMSALDKAIEADSPRAVTLGIALATTYAYTSDSVPKEHIESIVDRILPMSSKAFGEEDPRTELLRRMRDALRASSPKPPRKT